MGVVTATKSIVSCAKIFYLLLMTHFVEILFQDAFQQITKVQMTCQLVLKDGGAAKFCNEQGYSVGLWC